jgi:O-antigen/teichoic acid export membrane protein
MVYDQIFWKVDQFIISVMIGAAAVAVVGAAMRLVLIFMRFSTSLSEVFLPRVTKMVVNNASPDDLTDLMVKVGRIQLLVLGVILSGYLLFGQNLVGLWVGRADGSMDTYSAFLIGVIIMVPLTLPLIQNTGISILVAKNKHKFRSTVYFIIAVLNIGLTVIMVKRFGIIGASIATAIALTLGNGIIINIYYSRVIGLKIGRFFKDCVGRLAVPILISSGLGYLILGFLAVPNSWLNLIMCCLIYLAVYFAVMWLIGMNSYEKDMVKKVIGKIAGKKA